MFIDPGDFTPEALATIAPACGDCGSASTMASVQTIYPNRRDLWQRDDGSTPWYWLCGACGAYCGAHRDTLKPFGTPAGPEARQARMDAHAAFDPLWRRKMANEGISQTKARGKGYKWLAAQLGMDPKQCHIGEMAAADAMRVVEVCRCAKRRPSTPPLREGNDKEEPHVE